ncbi:DEAD/DEAH box helicase [Stygiolobus caldivivus]|uniref:DEAD/DEAH box helicase n=1 Tax=Stygiolobus caldivivus TaxID=2824673 RepID=A0A8D5U7W5_9CREN|nr:DEAD/DEAH box helicase [Stygiolobus caldivivus]BCU70827.1 DEAD/DEAH box helicase [Stygiolobus caldivivus]
MEKSLFDIFFENYTYGNNYLVTAPTGTGKTHIAKHLLTNTDEVVVYASPLKALSREVYKAIKDKRKAKYVDSDVYEEDLSNVDAEALLMTYEKLDSTIRHNYRWLRRVSLIIVDEVHNVESDRGLAIENIVLWAKANSVPIVALSATVPDVDKYAKWLSATLLKYDKRSVPLHECIAYPYVMRCFDDNRVFSLGRRGLRNVKLDLLLGILDWVISINKNALVFVKSRASAERLADTLTKFDVPAQPYHSGLPYETREKVLNDYTNNKVKVLVSTTALGQGVNLPVYAAIFYDVSLPESDEKGEFKGWRDLDPSEFKQIAGRAGRRGFDNEGYAIVIAESAREMERIRQKYFSKEVNGGVVTTPYTLENLALGVIAWGEGMGKDEIDKVVKGSLKFHDRDVSPALSTLEKENLVREEAGSVYLTELGRAVALSYIDVASLKGFPVNVDDFDPLSVISSSPEVLQALRGCNEGKELLRRWANGEDILDVCKKLTAKDIEEVLSNARWIAFALYRVLKALHKKTDEVRDLYMSLKYGVPPAGIPLAEKKLHRGVVMKLLAMGVKGPEELCVVSGLKEVERVLTTMAVEELTYCTPYLLRLSEFVRENYGKEIDRVDSVVKQLLHIGVLYREGDKIKWKEYKVMTSGNT